MAHALVRFLPSVVIPTPLPSLPRMRESIFVFCMRARWIPAYAGMTANGGMTPVGMGLRT
ncbi:hypothetical protein DWU98_08085 [Dyella monticola]|uniref:Uncharacterized protein n=1 Tax=Dyella monticola TaxID=1927958 RepID=A0A370X3W3_9GAMM|nr:hypothetical protein DWU98_08085 [Dyella monticola]